MVTVTLLLVAGAGASMTTAGLVVTGYTLGQAVTGPLRGRLADRRGLVAVSAVCGGVYALALLGLLAGSLARSPAWLLVAAAAVAGLSVPPLSPGMRGLWSALAGGTLRQAAFALDAAVFDLAYITGPALASSLAAGLAPAAAVGLLIALTSGAVLIIGARTGPAVSAPAGPGGGTGPRSETGRRSLLGPLNSAALRRLLLTGALVNVALSATEVALTAYVRQRHALWASGPLLAEVSVGSIAGSLLLGARAAARRARRREPSLAETAGLLRARPGGPGRGRPACSADRGRRSAGRAVPGTFAGHPVRPDAGRRVRRRHRGAGLAELGDERRRSRRSSPGRGHRQPTGAVPGHHRRGSGRRGGQLRLAAPGSAADGATSRGGQRSLIRVTSRCREVIPAFHALRSR